jgi:hypothetical protein
MAMLSTKQAELKREAAERRTAREAAERRSERAQDKEVAAASAPTVKADANETPHADR